MPIVEKAVEDAIDPESATSQRFGDGGGDQLFNLARAPGSERTLSV